MTPRATRRSPHPVIKWIKIIGVVGAAYLTIAAVSTTVWNVLYSSVVSKSIDMQINNKWTNDQKEQVTKMIEHDTKDLRIKINCYWSVMTDDQKKRADDLYQQFAK